MKKRMEEAEIQKGDCGPPTRKVFFDILSDLNRAVPNHLADESQTRQPDTPPVVCPANAPVRQNLKKFLRDLFQQ